MDGYMGGWVGGRPHPTTLTDTDTNCIYNISTYLSPLPHGQARVLRLGLALPLPKLLGLPVGADPVAGGAEEGERGGGDEVGEALSDWGVGVWGCGGLGGG